jgi:hypothetical protein
MFRGFGSVFYKEVIQISRDPLTLLLMMAMPMVQLLLFGYAINTDVRNIRTAVYNLDPGPQSRDLLHAFENTDYFHIVRYVSSDEELNNAIVAGSVKVGIKIPPDYSDRLLGNRQATVLVLIDGSDSSIATQSLQVASQVGLTESLARLSTELESRSSQLPIEVRPKMLFNPDSRSANFMVPGLIAVILQIITTLLTAFSVVRERERGLQIHEAQADGPVCLCDRANEQVAERDRRLGVQDDVALRVASDDQIRVRRRRQIHRVDVLAENAKDAIAHAAGRDRTRDVDLLRAFVGVLEAQDVERELPELVREARRAIDPDGGDA